MAKGVTDGATFTCPHAGTASPTGSNKFTIGGTPNLLVTTDISSSVAISACTWTNATLAQVPCTLITALVSGGASKMTAGGIAVALDTDSYGTNGNGGAPPLMTIVETQTKVTAV